MAVQVIYLIQSRSSTAVIDPRLIFMAPLLRRLWPMWSADSFTKPITGSFSVAATVNQSMTHLIWGYFFAIVLRAYPWAKTGNRQSSVNGTSLNLGQGVCKSWCAWVHPGLVPAMDRLYNYQDGGTEFKVKLLESERSTDLLQWIKLLLENY